MTYGCFEGGSPIGLRSGCLDMPETMGRLVPGVSHLSRLRSTVALQVEVVMIDYW